MRQKEYLAAIRSDGKHLTLSTLVFPDELVGLDSIEEFDELDGVEVSDKELKMAQPLVEALSDEFEPDQYNDEYRKAVEELIEQKAAGRVPAFEAPPNRTGTVIDLAAALEASLADAHRPRTATPAAAPRRRRHAAPARRRPRRSSQRTRLTRQRHPAPPKSQSGPARAPEARRLIGARRL